MVTISSESARPHALRSILAASDLAEGSDTGLRAAAALARATEAELHAFHCVRQPPPLWEELSGGGASERWLRHARTDLEWQVRRVLGEEAAPTSMEVALGQPARQITERASQVSADLVVLGPHRSRGALDDLLGSTADRVIRISPVPCLSVNRRVRLPLRRILLLTDFSEPASHALEVGLDWLISSPALYRSETGPATIQLLHVSAFATPWQPGPVEPYLAQQAEAARRLIPEGEPLRLLPRIVSEPLPVDGIRRVADRWSADLIIMGTHGFSTLGRALFGSVASAVVRTVRYPILLVPPRHEAEPGQER